MTDTPDDIGTGRANRYEWEEFVSRILTRISALESVGGVALHYRVAGQTMTTVPDSEAWLPNLAGVNNEPTGVMDQEIWADTWPAPAADQDIPTSAIVARGLYCAIVTAGGSGQTFPTTGTTSFTFGSLVPSDPDAVFSLQTAGFTLRIDGNEGTAKGTMLVTTDDCPVGIEIDLVDGANWTPMVEIIMVKLADLPTETGGGGDI